MKLFDKRTIQEAQLSRIDIEFKFLFIQNILLKAFKIHFSTTFRSFRRIFLIKSKYFLKFNEEITVPK